jgi:hypothetical protein
MSSLLELGEKLRGPQAEAPAAAPEAVEPERLDTAVGTVNLTELGARLGIAKKPAAPAAQHVRGDDLMAEAHASIQATDEEKRLASLFQQSMQMVKAKAESDPAYGEKIQSELGGLAEKGGADFFNRVIDEADGFKVEALKKENPHWFNSGEAARVGFFNSATFGQMSKIIGAVGTVAQKIPGVTTAHDGQSYEEIVTAEAEKFRLLQKAFPGSFTVGDAAAYLVPGSPAKVAFSKTASFSTKVVGKALERLAKNPQALSGLARATVEAGAAGAGGAGAIAGVSGGLGTDLEEFSLDRGVREGVFASAVGGVAGAATAPAGAAFMAGAEKVRPFAQRWANRIASYSDEVVEGLTGTPAKAIRAARSRGAELRAAYGSEGKLGLRLAEKLDAIDDAGLPERKAADALLPQMGELNVSKVLRTAPAGATPAEARAYAGIQKEWDAHLTKIVERHGGTLDNAPAAAVRECIDQLQREGRRLGAYGAGSGDNLTGSVLREHAAVLRAELLTHATSFGKTGERYTKLMEKAASKWETYEYIRKELGRDPEKAGERLLANLFGRNKEIMRQRMRSFDETYGTSFLKEAEDAHMARMLGPGGNPQWLPAQPTGRSNLGFIASTTATTLGTAAGYVTGDTATGAGVGATLGGVVAAASSPKVAARMLGASDSMTGFVKAMVARPDALARVAGKYAGKAGSEALFRGNGVFHASRAAKEAVQAQDRAAVQLERLKVPVQIQRLAQQVYRTLQKDGPVSAASTTRIIADSPYFLGLVHYFDVAARSSKAAQGTEGIAKFQPPRPQEGVATPR